MEPVHLPSMKESLFFLISGFVVSVPLTLFTGTLTDSLCFVLPLFYAQFCSTAIFTPLIEEFAKAYPLFFRHGETERSVFILGFLVGLGFGFSEFILFVFQLGAPVLIRIPALFFHAASTSITSYGISQNRTIPFFVLSVTLHFLNNSSAFFGNYWYVGGLGALVTSYIISWRLFKKTSHTIYS